MRINFSKTSALVAAAVAVSFPAEAQAQAQLEILEEIVVTAGFRDQGLMTTPGSITVVEEAIIDDRAAQHLESVLNATPNINYSSGASRARFIQVRGVGDLGGETHRHSYRGVVGNGLRG